MKRSKLAAAGGLCLLIVCLPLIQIGAAAAQGEARPQKKTGHAGTELPYTKGIVAYKKAEYAKAVEEFKKVLSIEPEHKLGAHYLGLCLSALGRFDEAADVFAALLQRQPDYDEARFNYAAALIGAKRFEAAESELKQVEGKLKDKAGVEYYLGYCRFKLGDPKEAIRRFENEAKREGSEFREKAVFYKAFALFALGEKDSAREELVKASGSFKPGSEYSRAAAYFSGKAPSAPQEGKLMSLSVTAGGVFDDNPTLATAGGEGGKDAGGAPFYSFNLGLRPYRGEKSILGADASVYRNYYVKGEAKDFSLTSLETNVYFGYGLDVFGTVLHLRPAYEFSLNLLDGDDLNDQESHGMSFGISANHGRAFSTRLRLGGRLSRFGLRERDAVSEDHGLGEAVSLLSGKLRIFAEARYAKDYSRGKRYDAIGPGGFLGVTWSVFPGLDLSAWGSANFDRYSRSAGLFGNPARADNVTAASGGVSYSFLDHMTAEVRYIRFDHRSNIPLFDYDRNMVIVSMTGGI